MSSNAPYFIEASDLKKFPGPDPDQQDNVDQNYPELNHANGADSIYALADGAMQAHERNQFANLVQAAEAAHEGREASLTKNEEPRNTPRKRKRQSPEDEDEESQQHDDQPIVNRAPRLSSAASALFRKPSTNSKKYTRLPMAQLFSKLELAPESFLQLQSKAKAYMLDPEHPDRQDTVGQRGKGDSELVKLRLWNCVKSFLEEEGNGRNFFGPDQKGENGTYRSMIWPQNENAIISAVTPLMRRMVTNERQRQYAVETRKSGVELEVKKTKPEQVPSRPNDTAAGQIDAFPPSGPSDPSAFTPTSRALFRELTREDIAEYRPAKMYVVPCAAEDPSLLAAIDTFFSQAKSLEPEIVGILATIDHHFRVSHREGLLNVVPCDSECESELIQRFLSSSVLNEILCNTNCADDKPTQETTIGILYAAFRRVQEAVVRTTALTAELSPASETPILVPEPIPISMCKVRVTHVCPRTGGLLGPRREISADLAPYLHTVAQEGVAYAGPSFLIREPRVRVHLPDGLKIVKDDQEWTAALDVIKKTPWLYGVVTVLVDYGSNSDIARAGAT